MARNHILIGLGCIFLVVGCDHTRWNIFKAPEPAPTKVPSVDQLVTYLNDNAGRVQTARCDNLSLTCYSGIQSFGLTGKLWVEKPRNLRLVAEIGSNRVVDMGSNDQEFWYWVSKADPPYQFFCAYKNLKEGPPPKYMPFPFQPEWVMEAMGLGPYAGAERYSQETDGQTVRLVEKSLSPQGKPVRKVIIFNRRPVQPPNPQMTACLLLDDATGKEICSAHILETQLSGKDNGILPRKLELRWPDNKLKMVLSLAGTSINQQLPQAPFQRQTMPGVPSVDLATGLIDGKQPTHRLQSSR